MKNEVQTTEAQQSIIEQTIDCAARYQLTRALLQSVGRALARRREAVSRSQEWLRVRWATPMAKITLQLSANNICKGQLMQNKSN